MRIISISQSLTKYFLKKIDMKHIFHRNLSSSQGLGAIDVHTHMYTPRYMDILRKRTTIPKVVRINDLDRLVILPDEDKEKSTSIGRPIGREYFDVNAKLKFMDVHNIDISCISLANPWLDFLSGKEAENVSQELNDELQNICEHSNGRLFGFATLPVRNSEASIKEIRRLKQLSKIKGVILGTPGAGKGLDDENFRKVLEEISNENLMIFLHPHYGVGNEHFHDSGHSLFLALGFPFETTVSLARLIVSGTLDKVKNLKILVAHSGAALPSLIGRLDSCVEHDNVVANRLHRQPSDYFRDFFFDAISYSPQSLRHLIDHVGVDRIMFGTDNPFFPPPGKSGEDIIHSEWKSTMKVYNAINELNDASTQRLILRDNAKRLFHI